MGILVVDDQILETCSPLLALSTIPGHQGDDMGTLKLDEWISKT